MTNTNTLMHIDSRGVAHTFTRCEEFIGPVLGSMMLSGIVAQSPQPFPVCADCEPLD